MSELRPGKTLEQIKPLVDQFIANYTKCFNVAPEPELISKWCGEMVLKLQEAYTKNYLEGYSVHDLKPFANMLNAAMEPPKNRKPVL